MNNIGYFRELTLKLSLVKGFGIRTFFNYWDKYEVNNVEEFFSITEIQKLLSANESEVREKFHNINNNYTYLCIWEADYPSRLKNISDPPLILYYLGNKDLLAKETVAIVGTRGLSNYGKMITQKLSTEFTKLGFVIISGMAFGVDSYAHRSAISIAKESTIAVLASPVDEPTPVSMEKLYKNILSSKGLIVSGTEPGKEIKPGMFASRNRIIAGLARAVIVTEAGADSGALITAKLAFDYNRAVFAIPGDITRSKSIGTNSIIKTNIAKLIDNIEDVLVELGYKFEQTTLNIESNKQVLDQSSKSLLELIRNGANTIDQLEINLPAQNKNAILSLIVKLELSGYITRNSDGFIHLKI